MVPLSGPGRQGIPDRWARDVIDDVNSSGASRLGGAKLKLVLYDTGDSAEGRTPRSWWRRARCGRRHRLLALELHPRGDRVTERAEHAVDHAVLPDLITGRGFNHLPDADRGARPPRCCRTSTSRQVGGRQATKVAFIGDNSASSVSFMKAIPAAWRGPRPHDRGRRGLHHLADATTLQKIRSGRPTSSSCSRRTSATTSCSSTSSPSADHRQRDSAGRRRWHDGARAGQGRGHGAPEG